MARWKNITLHGHTIRAEFGNKGEVYEIPPGATCEIPDVWTPWMISRGYPVEQIDAVAQVTAPVVESPKPALESQPTPTESVSSPVAFSDGDDAPPTNGEPPKTAVNRRGQRSKASTPTGG